MTNIRTISGIPEPLWKQAQKEYVNTSKKIKELLEEDLKGNQEQDDMDLLKNSGLTADQRKVAEDVMTSGQKDKNESQLGKIISKHYTDKQHRSKCKSALTNDENLPYESDGRGIKATEIDCRKCDAVVSFSAAKKSDWVCPNCDSRFYDL